MASRVPPPRHPPFRDLPLGNRGPRIGAGVSAEVFARPDGTALKLFHAGSIAPPDRELAAARVAHAAGLPVPEPFQAVEEDGRRGIVFERIHERPLPRRLRRWPGAVLATLWSLASRQAAAHRVVVAAGDLPDVHDLLASRIAVADAPEAVIAAAMAALAALPRGDRLGHGDLHLGNVMNAGGRMLLIDWAQAARGAPAADVARSELVMRFGRYAPALRRWHWARVARHAAARWYLWCYRLAGGIGETEVEAWRLPVAVAWWREGSAAHLPALADYVEHRLTRR